MKEWQWKNDNDKNLCEKERIYPIKSIFFLLAVYFMYEIYGALSAGAVYAHGSTFTIQETPLTFLSRILYEITILCFLVYMIFWGIQEKNEGDNGDGK